MLSRLSYKVRQELDGESPPPLADEHLSPETRRVGSVVSAAAT